jgi:hypothetical protein
MSHIDFTQINNIYYKNNIIDNIYYKNITLLEKETNSKYPFKLNFTNLNVIDVDSTEFDINVASATYIKYKKYLNVIKGLNKEQELKSFFENKKGGNLLKNTNDFAKNDIWTGYDNYIIENETYENSKIVSIKTAWIPIGQKVKVEAGKTYQFSAWIKTEKVANDISAFINIEGGTVIVSDDYKGYHLTNQWARYNYKFTAEKSGECLPRFEIPKIEQGQKVYFSKFMLTEGNDLYDWNDGIVTLPYEKEILSKLFDDRPKVLKAISDFVFYTVGISTNLDKRIQEYIHKLDAKLIKIKDWLENNYSDIEVNTRKFIEDKQEYIYKSVVSNPLIGYAPYGRWEQSLGEIDFNLVYCDMKWNEVQNNDENSYDWEKWEKLSLYQYWRNKGKHCVFRLILDEPTTKKHHDVPNFIYKDKTMGKDYSHEYGKGWSPYYENQKFIDKLKIFVDKLAERYGNDPFISYIQLGVVGHWGEWHVNFDNNKVRKLPKMPILKKYVDMWIGKFPYAKIMMRRPFSPCKEYGLGTYNDMIGMPSDTQDWLGWIEKGGVYDQTDETDAIVPIPDIWDRCPIGGEFTSSLTMDEMLLQQLDRTKEMIKKSHHIFIGQKIPENNVKWNSQSKEISDMLGYKLFIKSSKINTDNIEIEIENRGISRFYHEWDFDLIVHNDLGNIVETKKINKSLVEIGNETVKINVSVHLDTNYRYSLGIKDPMTKQYTIKFSNNGQDEENLFNIY